MGAYLSYFVRPIERPETEHNPLEAATRDQDDPLQDFAKSLDNLVKQCVNAESKDKSSTSRLIASLLGVVHVLQDQIDALGVALKENKQQNESETTQEAVSTPEGYLVLHRVFCDSQDHCHNGVVYEDEPQISNNLGWGVDEVLRGNQPIFNVETYLSQRIGIHFIVFKEYVCGTGHSLHVKQGDDDNNDNVQAISERKERLWVITRSLHDALVEVIGADVYNTTASASHVREMNAPYTSLFHYQEKLRRVAEAHPYPAYEAAVATLLAYLEQNYRVEYDEALQMFQAGLVSALHLDKLFKSNDLVIARKINHRSVRAGVLTTCHWNQVGSLTLRGWCWGDDGVRLLRVPWTSTVNWTRSLDKTYTRPITELKVYPFQYAPIAEQEHLKERGYRYWNGRDRYYCEYSGLEAHGRRDYSGSRFMIDVSMYYQVHGVDRGDYSRVFDAEDTFALDAASDHNVMLHNDRWPIEIPVTQKDLGAECVLMLPPTIGGFNMVTKSWIWLHVSGLSDVAWDERVFESLVLDQQHKDMVNALVTSQSQASTASESLDLVRGKGKGLIILLHGAPGTGKTLTAESIAEHTHRPLYHLSSGDLGDDASSVEMHLARAMSLGEKWNCILLIDEADVFLQQRNESNLARNALVSVFLRALEYYSGTLLLTTNRVGTFDEAFMSRIHLSLRYETPAEKARYNIWANMLRLYKDQNSVHRVEEIMGRLGKLAVYELNGRQIRNLLVTSMRMAQSDGRKLRYKDILHAMRQTTSFDVDGSPRRKKRRPSDETDSDESSTDSIFDAVRRTSEQQADWEDFKRKEIYGRGEIVQ